ncbi:hypothetical protein N7539_006618 [Penicillium diatomitis]|uniref:Nascent polypeptide-associated complex subunit alpha-like UBA domain-containing protein n=1 Tax=Penicillium diatomitis TaxID=2819901 RepID=A0A9X0BS43_9EURO|nr:uncharacterized protein N7539_006618 [Penicillium diatomitis]KAJ5480724.1 hypothetical protein N7539_006618 [Penicillium diatomitis]
MSDPIPSATANPDASAQHVPSNAEDRKAAAALDSLNPEEVSSDSTAPPGPTNAQQEALNKAMSRLEVAAGQTPDDKKKVTGAQKKEPEAPRKVVKVNPADVTLLVEQLELNKSKATDLLRANEGDVNRAIEAFITPSIRV